MRASAGLRGYFVLGPRGIKVVAALGEGGMSAPAGFEGKVDFVWKVADRLRGHFKRHEYGSVMLPTLVLFRLDSVLAPTRDAVIKASAGRDLNSPATAKLLQRVAGNMPFYNTSPLSLRTMLSDDKNLGESLQMYVNAFSPAATEVLEAFRYHETIERLGKAGVLYAVLSDFAELDLRPSMVSDEAMGYVFEELLRKFNEMSNETAGEHYTPREVIRLMVALLLDEDSEALRGQAPVRRVYDPAAGTGGMLTTALDQVVKGYNDDAIVAVSGQELNPESWAMARSELMMRGLDPDCVVLGNSLTEDGFAHQQFDYMLSNPPYGVDWKGYADPIRTEAASSALGNRFSAGLPRISDGSFLFLQHMISKMKPVTATGGGSRIGIVLSGSPLFSGGAGSGESEIRRWIIENDWLEGIVALPDQMFYNTGISTYVWIVTNRKPLARRGTVTLVDGRGLGTKMRKSLGDKRKELTDTAIDQIVELFASPVQTEAGGELDARVKVMRNADFGFARLTVERPLRQVWRVDATAFGVVASDTAELLAPLEGTTWSESLECRRALNSAGFEAKVITKLLKTLATTDPDIEPTPAKKGPGFEPDASLRDQENIPLPDGYLAMDEISQRAAVEEAAAQHLVEQIHPYVPDAWLDHDKTRIGYEIPFTRQFYVYTPPRPVAEIRAEIDELEQQIQQWMQGLSR